MIEQYTDVPTISFSQNDTSVKFATSSASTSHVYTDEMRKLKERVSEEPVSKSANQINS